MNTKPSRETKPLNVKPGSWVRVRSKEEIFATLDADGRLDKLPFQPEMLAFCGKRMKVAKVAHKTCDTVNKTGGRKMERAYHLEGGRCDGSGHGGCQADCVFFWKEEWLRSEQDTSSFENIKPGPCNEATVVNRAKAHGQEDSVDPAWVCQTTALYEATTLLKWWDIRQYITDITCGNHSAWHMFKIIFAAGYRNLVGLGYGYRILVSAYNAFQKLRGGKPFPVAIGHIADGKPTPAEKLDLKPGEWVEVKSPEEIMPTLTKNGFNRGMRYDMEMLKYSGQRYRVEMVVEKLINEQTGKMMPMKTPCIQLEKVYCRAECTPMRLGCPRASNSYWREIWLRRVAGENVE